MEKILRLAREFLFSLFFYKNPLVYFRERLGLTKEGRFILRLPGGIRYALNANTNEIRMVNEIWNLKVYDSLLRNIREGSTVIDIGANIGVFSIKAARAAKNVKVFSYEPFPKSFAGLKENIRLNGLEGNVFLKNVAVAGKRSELELFFRPWDPGGVSIHKYGDKTELKSIKVPAVALEDVFRENKIATCGFMKIDCEGAEESILMDTPKSLFNRIQSITLEWHYDLNKLSIEEFQSFLEDLGYKTRYNPSTLTLYAQHK